MFTKETASKAFLSFTIGEERVQESYCDLLTAIDAKLLQLKGQIPFTIRDEIELHKRVLQYIDSCIALINIMKNLMDLPKLTFPPHHYLLRAFRDHNHHVGYLAFVPMGSFTDGTDFFVTPTLMRVDGAKNISCIPETTVLKDLINMNHDYICEIIGSEKQKFLHNGEPLFSLRKEYPMGFAGFVAKKADTENGVN